MQYIDKIDELTGNNPVDFVILNDGRVLGIDAESVVLYASMDDFYGYATVDRPSIKPDPSRQIIVDLVNAIESTTGWNAIGIFPEDV